MSVAGGVTVQGRNPREGMHTKESWVMFEVPPRRCVRPLPEMSECVAEWWWGYRNGLTDGQSLGRTIQRAICANGRHSGFRLYFSSS